MKYNVNCSKCNAEIERDSNFTYLTSAPKCEPCKKKDDEESENLPRIYSYRWFNR